MFEYERIRLGCPDTRPSDVLLSSELRPAAFLDRDGVVNTDRGYVHLPEDFEWTPGILPAIRALNDANYAVIFVTNQSGIGRGYYTENDFLSLSRWMLDEADREGALIDAVYYCPHHPEGEPGPYRLTCPARKPGTGMLERAQLEFSLDKARSFLIGDRESDLGAAIAFGIEYSLFESGDVQAVIASHIGG